MEWINTNVFRTVCVGVYVLLILLVWKCLPSFFTVYIRPFAHEIMETLGLIRQSGNGSDPNNNVPRVRLSSEAAMVQDCLVLMITAHQDNVEPEALMFHIDFYDPEFITIRIYGSAHEDLPEV